MLRRDFIKNAIIGSCAISLPVLAVGNEEYAQLFDLSRDSLSEWFERIKQEAIVEALQGLLAEESLV